VLVRYKFSTNERFSDHIINPNLISAMFVGTCHAQGSLCAFPFGHTELIDNGKYTWRRIPSSFGDRGSATNVQEYARTACKRDKEVSQRILPLGFHVEVKECRIRFLVSIQPQVKGSMNGTSTSALPDGIGDTSPMSHLQSLGNPFPRHCGLPPQPHGYLHL
jgi:hypothetical protein